MGRSIISWLCVGGAILAPGASFATPTWWFQDPTYPGDRNVGTYVALGGQPSYTWWDDDVSWGTGSVVRLPEDADYLGDVLTCVACYSGGSQTMHSPYFKGASGKVYFFNHMETIYLPSTGWYNGGAVIGLTGGGTCQTGYGTFCGTSTQVSTGPHFCIETANQHTDVDFPTNFTPTSSCTHSDGSSGMANVLCTGSAQCAQYACGSTYYQNCESDGNLHSCNASGAPTVTSCNGLGCHTTGTCTNDACNNACGPYTYQGKYYWNCQPDGNLQTCDASGTVITKSCGGSGCTGKPAGVDDVCNSPCAAFLYQGRYVWSCMSDGNLHSCDASNTPVVTSCNGSGCTVQPLGTDDVCKPSAACKPYACGGGYNWTCEADGNLHSCDSAGAPVVTTCSEGGCSAKGTCMNDSCNGVSADAGQDAGSVAADAGARADAGGSGADASVPEADAGQHGGHHGGCGATGGDGAVGIALALLAMVAARRRR